MEDPSKSKKINSCSPSTSQTTATDSRINTNTNSGDQYDTVWECVIPYVRDPRDRGAVSLVCKRWYAIDAITRSHITIALCYAAVPQQLSRRFPQLESLKIKGQPRAATFNLMSLDWGGYVAPWVKEIVVSSSFPKLRALHFRRMIVTDSDLVMIASSNLGSSLEALKLDRCSGFSSDGLLQIGRLCRNLRILFMEESMIVENDGEWIHQLALNNTVLENLNFYMTDLEKVRSGDIELLARRCPSLASVKISEFDILDLTVFFGAATSLEEFGGGSVSAPPAQNEDVIDAPPEKYAAVVFPPKMCRLGLTFLGRAEIPIVYPVASKLRKLDLIYAMLDTEGHCRLLPRCPNLEVLEARDVIGDRGLEVVAQFCKKLKRLRIERGEDEQELEDVEGIVTQRGLIALAQGCSEMEYLAVYVSDITNASLECIGTYLKNMSDFRLVLLDREEHIADLPLDNGVRSLLMNCDKLRRFALYLRPGGLTNVGLYYIGRYSPKVRWMLLGHVGESDEGLLQFSQGCPSLEKLEMRGCCFSDHALAKSVLQLKSLRYLWVQGYRESGSGQGLLDMVRPYWNVELIPARHVELVQVANGQIQRTMLVEHQILAYYSLAGQRNDFPNSVVPLDPNAVLNQ